MTKTSLLTDAKRLRLLARRLRDTNPKERYYITDFPIVHAIDLEDIAKHIEEYVETHT